MRCQKPRFPNPGPGPVSLGVSVGTGVWAPWGPGWGDARDWGCLLRGEGEVCGETLLWGVPPPPRLWVKVGEAGGKTPARREGGVRVGEGNGCD